MIEVFHLVYEREKKDVFLSLFENLCDNVCNLVIKQIAINIKLLFEIEDETEAIFNLCHSKYLSHFENKELTVLDGWYSSFERIERDSVVFVVYNGK